MYIHVTKLMEQWSSEGYDFTNKAILQPKLVVIYKKKRKKIGKLKT